MARILPHTEHEDAFAIAERVRQAIAALRVPRLDGGEPLQITASLKVSSRTGGGEDELIADDDAAPCRAEREARTGPRAGAHRPRTWASASKVR